MKNWLWRSLSYLAYGLVRLLHLSYRFRDFQRENQRLALNQSPTHTVIYCAWHEHLLPTVMFMRGSQLAPLVSKSQDGSMIAFTMQRYGFLPTRGSSSRGGIEARMQLAKRLQEGWSPSITPDGPRGPRRQAKAGAIDIARRAGIPIVPVLAVRRDPWVFKSWDRFKLPKPFSTIYAGFGTPIWVPSDTKGESFAHFQRELENALNELERNLLIGAGLSASEAASVACVAPQGVTPSSSGAPV